ncbi:MAG: hypothetical protein BGN85_03030 [Alphaproteobacteria bacterium 64-11]|nr:MAG: hypothetical protein BGN85_03030 [Alphaproteobacteria bacterium 64-11]
MEATMKILVPLILLAVTLGGCTATRRAPPPYAVQYGPWSNYDPDYEYGGYRRSDEPIAWYGPYDAPYRRPPGY